MTTSNKKKILAGILGATVLLTSGCYSWKSGVKDMKSGIVGLDRTIVYEDALGNLQVIEDAKYLEFDGSSVVITLSDGKRTTLTYVPVYDYEKGTEPEEIKEYLLTRN